MMDILRIDHLFKSFGDNKVIDDLSFSVPEGSIFGFIGPNGAGKTTTMKMVLGLLRADSGQITVCDEPVTFGQTKTNRFIGYLPDVPEFYNYMKPKEYLALCGQITGLEAAAIKSRSGELLSMVGLEKANKRIGTFSRGMKQRLGIAQALLNGPRLLICDEPTSALDPIGRKEILEILQQVKGKTTVIFSTHILSDVERICDRISVLYKGRLAMSGTLTELKAQHKRDSLLIEFASAADKQRFVDIPKIKPLLVNADQTYLGITLHSGDVQGAEAATLDALSQGGILPIKIEVLEPTIESLFMEVVR